MKSNAYLQANLHEAIQKALKYNLPVYLTILGGISFESGDYKIEKTNEGIIITEKGKEVFGDISQQYRNPSTEDIFKDKQDGRPKPVSNKRRSE